MDQLADRLDRAADTMAALERRMPTLAIDAVAFAADDGGLPGRLGRDLHAHWAAVLEARSHEAADVAARLAGTAGSVRTTHRHYTETDDAARRRILREV